MQTKIMITLFGLFAEAERDLISERTKEGLIRAKEQGRHRPGRPEGSLSASKLDGKEQEIMILLKKGVSRTAIAKIGDPYPYKRLIFSAKCLEAGRPESQGNKW